MSRHASADVRHTRLHALDHVRSRECPPLSQPTCELLQKRKPSSAARHSKALGATCHFPICDDSLSATRSCWPSSRHWSTTLSHACHNRLTIQATAQPCAQSRCPPDL